ncbi:LuxR C-terminal-related transcriptional regulator [Streptomyces sp. NPDC048514]|uniref:LuxR C-terminal-related transcriptional regulator n=1 Tax=Streptomyces sp. NPDC048514 TaxID=3365564 RepID=UPI00371E0B20
MSQPQRTAGDRGVRPAASGTDTEAGAGTAHDSGDGTPPGDATGAALVAGTGRRWPFAGREHELVVFRSHLADDRVSALLLAGAAGVGKSRLAEECLRHAERAGHRVERVTASRADAALPLGALGHLLPGEPVHDPVALFQAAVRAFAPHPVGVAPRPVGGGSPRAVICVDDLPLLDNASAVLLGHLMRTGTVFVLGTVRTPGPPSDIVDSFTHDAGTRRLELPAFGATQTGEVVRAALGGAVEHATLRTLAEHSRGNPLLLRELVTGALASGRLRHDDRLWRLTGRLTESARLTAVVSGRLAEVGARRRQVLELLALCGPLPLDALAGRCDRREAGETPGDVEARADVEVLEDVEALEELGLIRLRVAGRRTVCALDHPLFGQVVRRGIDAGRRRELYRHQADRLAALGARRREDALRLASWRLAAGLPVGLEVLLPAARMARHVRDYPTVLELLAGVPRPDAVLEVWLLLGEAHHHTGGWAAAEECLRTAQELAERDEDLVTVVMERTQNLYWGLGDMGRTLEVNARAAARLDAAGQRVLRINEAAYRLYCGRVPDVLRLLADAEAVAVPRLRMWAQLQRSLALCYAGRTDAAARLAQAVHEELTAAEREQRPGCASSHASGPAIYRVAALSDAGRGEEARAVGREAFDQAVAAQALAPQIWLAAHLGRCELVFGQLAAAREWFTEALGLARGHGVRRAAAFAGAGLAAVHAQAGRAAEAERELAALDGCDVERQQATLFLRQLAIAWLSASGPARPEAVRVLVEAAGRAREAGMAAYEGWLLADAARLGAADRVRRRLAELAATGDGPLVGVRAEVAAGLADRDHHALRETAERCERLGFDMAGAEAARAASLLASREGETRAAAYAAVLSRRLLDRCGTDRLVAPSPRPAELRPLTRREREVVRLAAEGLTSQEIAARLVLSVRTVDNHLHRAFAKLGVSSRRDLATADWSSGRAPDGRAGAGRPVH